MLMLATAGAVNSVIVLVVMVMVMSVVFPMMMVVMTVTTVLFMLVMVMFVLIFHKNAPFYSLMCSKPMFRILLTCSSLSA